MASAASASAASASACEGHHAVLHHLLPRKAAAPPQQFSVSRHRGVLPQGRHSHYAVTPHVVRYERQALQVTRYNHVVVCPGVSCITVQSIRDAVSHFVELVKTSPTTSHTSQHKTHQRIWDSCPAAPSRTQAQSRQVSWQKASAPVGWRRLCCRVAAPPASALCSPAPESERGESQPRGILGTSFS